MKIKWFCALALLISYKVSAQPCAWQQGVEYTINARLNVATHRLTGDERLVYYNRSPDTLRRVYFHMYFNAFQPGSMMDVRSRSLPDPDQRVRDRISLLHDEEIGYQRMESLTQDGESVDFSMRGTLLEATLNRPVMPGQKTSFQMRFEAQVPVQIRRSGRDSKEGIAYSMTQWYPKMAEYDVQGWHTTPYIAREFFGVWGDYDVTLTLDADFMVAGTGILQNADKIGYGYSEKGMKRKKEDVTTWHFVARNVHDFAWAADPDYRHVHTRASDGTVIRFFYQPGEKTTENWEKMKTYAVKHFDYMDSVYGDYPYPSYSVIQGGDGGMEYPMCTLVTGERSLKSLVGVVVHEMSHSWFQGALATNESLYPWMDEGFTTFASSESMARLFAQPSGPHQVSYLSYMHLVEKDLQEPLSTHSDHYNTNTAYGVGAYSMGALFLQQLEYLIGKKTFYNGMKRYYNAWKMKHPNPNDFIRIMEKESGLQLQWYLRYWIYSTKRIDYGIEKIENLKAAGTRITLKRIGKMPMPIDLWVTYKNGEKEIFYIPLNETMGAKRSEDTSTKRTVLETWNWVDPSYAFEIPDKKKSDIKEVEIDPTRSMADIDLSNNKVEVNMP